MIQVFQAAKNIQNHEFFGFGFEDFRNDVPGSRSHSLKPLEHALSRAELSTADLGESRWTDNSARLGWCSGAGRVKSKDIEAETLSIKLTITHK